MPMSSYATCLSCFLFPKSEQGLTEQVLASLCKLTLKLKFEAHAVDTWNWSLINKDERLQLLKKGWLLAQCQESWSLFWLF